MAVESNRKPRTALANASVRNSHAGANLVDREAAQSQQGCARAAARDQITSEHPQDDPLQPSRGLEVDQINKCQVAQDMIYC